MNAAVAVRTVLERARDEGADFDHAWYRALRAVNPPDGAGPDAVAQSKEDRQLLGETKEYWRSYYDRDAVRKAALAAGYRSARRRLRDMFLDDEGHQHELAELDALRSEA